MILSFIGEAADDRIVLEEALGLPLIPETESQRMIRLGEMTPFGTIMSVDCGHLNQHQNQDGMSDFEKYLLDQSQLSGGRRTASGRHQGSVTAAVANSCCKRKKMAVKSKNHSGNEGERVKERKTGAYCTDGVIRHGSMEEGENTQEGLLNEYRGVTDDDDGDDDYIIDGEESNHEDMWKDEKMQYRLGEL